MIIILFSLCLTTSPIQFQICNGCFPTNSDMPNSRSTRQSQLCYVPNYPLIFSQRQPIDFLRTLWNKWNKLIPENASRSQTKRIIKYILLRDYPDVLNAILILIETGLIWFYDIVVSSLWCHLNCHDWSSPQSIIVVFFFFFVYSW